MAGKLKGAIPATTPSGCRIVCVSMLLTRRVCVLSACQQKGVRIVITLSAEGCALPRQQKGVSAEGCAYCHQPKRLPHRVRVHVADALDTLGVSTRLCVLSEC